MTRLFNAFVSVRITALFRATLIDAHCTYIACARLREAFNVLSSSAALYTFNTEELHKKGTRNKWRVRAAYPRIIQIIKLIRKMLNAKVRTSRKLLKTTYCQRFISKRTLQPNVQKSAWENNQT